MKINFVLPFILTFSFALYSCKKEAGEGGSSSITGKIYVKDYNGTFTILNGEYYGADEDVYIIYGDEISYGNRLKTNYDGIYQFKYLRKGPYKIYAYSKDSSKQSVSGIKEVVVEVTITKSKDNIVVPDIIILK